MGAKREGDPFLLVSIAIYVLLRTDRCMKSRVMRGQKIHNSNLEFKLLPLLTVNCLRQVSSF